MPYKTHLAFLLVLTASSAIAKAGGLFLPETGTQAQSRAGAFIAKADDPSALALNPAGLSQLPGTQIILSINFVDYRLTFQRAGNYEPTELNHPYEGQPFPSVSEESKPQYGLGGFQALPTLVISSDLGLKLPFRLAAGIFVPQGYPQRKFAETQTLNPSGVVAPGPQRYDVIEQNVIAAMPSIAASTSIGDWLDLGARFTWALVQFQATNSLWATRNFEEAPEKDGLFLVKAGDNFVPGFALGALLKPDPRFSFGIVYTGAMQVRGSGFGQGAVGSQAGLPGVADVVEPITEPDRVRCRTGGKIGALATCVELTLPQTFTLGGRWRWFENNREKADIELDLRWEDWSAGSNYDIVVDGKSGSTGVPLQPSRIRHGTIDVFSARLGGSYSIAAPGGQILFRAGAAYDTATVPDSWTRVEFDGAARFTLATGLAYEFFNVRIEAGGGLVLEPSREVGMCAPPYGPNASSPGCLGNGRETPTDDRPAPDPVQPLEDMHAQTQSPFNAGKYRSSYLMFGIGVTTWF